MTNGDIGRTNAGDIWKRVSDDAWVYLTQHTEKITHKIFSEMGGEVIFKMPATENLAAGSVLRGSFLTSYIAAKDADGWWNTNWDTAKFSDESIIEEFNTCGAGGYVVAAEVKS